MNGSETIRLTPEDVALVTRVAVARQQYHTARGGQHRGENLDPIGNAILGYLCEMGAARILGAEFHADVNGDRDRPDVVGIEIRGVTQPWHKLLVSQIDLDKGHGNRLFVLATRERNDITLIGGCYGHEAKSLGTVMPDKYSQRDPMTGEVKTVWGVPQYRLAPWLTLKPQILATMAKNPT